MREVVHNGFELRVHPHTEAFESTERTDMNGSRYDLPGGLVCFELGAQPANYVEVRI